MKRFLILTIFFIVTSVSLLTVLYKIEDAVALNEYESHIIIDTTNPAVPVKEVDALDKLEMRFQEVEAESVYYELTDEERTVVENIVMGEAGGEPYDGQVLVAQCILNAAVKDGLKPSEIRTEYRYSGWNENPTESVKTAVSEVFDNGVKVVEEPILYFYAPARARSNWHESLDFVIEVGGHRFFKE